MNVSGNAYLCNQPNLVVTILTLTLRVCLQFLAIGKATLCSSSIRRMVKSLANLHWTLECIPVGCVPSAAVAVWGLRLGGGVYAQRGKGVTTWGVSTSPLNRMTDRCKTFTFPQHRLRTVKSENFLWSLINIKSSKLKFLRIHVMSYPCSVNESYLNYFAFRVRFRRSVWMSLFVKCTYVTQSQTQHDLLAAVLTDVFTMTKPTGNMSKTMFVFLSVMLFVR